MKVFVSALTMPEQLEKDELGRLGKIQTKTKKQPQNKNTSHRLLKVAEVETAEQNNLAARPPPGSPRAPNPGI